MATFLYNNTNDDKGAKFGKNEADIKKDVATLPAPVL